MHDSRVDGGTQVAKRAGFFSVQLSFLLPFCLRSIINYILVNTYSLTRGLFLESTCLTMIYWAEAKTPDLNVIFFLIYPLSLFKINASMHKYVHKGPISLGVRVHFKTLSVSNLLSFFGGLSNSTSLLSTRILSHTHLSICARRWTLTSQAAAVCRVICVRSYSLCNALCLLCSVRSAFCVEDSYDWGNDLRIW